MLISTYELIIKKSKFIGYLYKVDSIDEVDNILENLKKANKKARHMPYAYRLDNQIKKSDDKEPSGTAGLPILSSLDMYNLDHALLVIVRYFGGTKLGAGPLMRTYRKVAVETIKNLN